MRMTLKEELKKCKTNLRKLLNKRDKWIREHPGQVCNISVSFGVFVVPIEHFPRFVFQL